MRWAKRGLAAGLLAAGVLGVAAAGERPADDKELATWVTKRVQEWQPTKDERRFDDIAWAKDIREAERLAKEHGRPVFLFTHDGHMAVGRC
jgi:hypothetical protein